MSGFVDFVGLTAALFWKVTSPFCSCKLIDVVFFLRHMVIEVFYCDAKVMSQVHIGQLWSCQHWLSGWCLEGRRVDMMSFTLAQISVAFSATLQTSCPTLSGSFLRSLVPVCMIMCEDVPKLWSESTLRTSPVLGQHIFYPCRNFPLEYMKMAVSQLELWLLWFSGVPPLGCGGLQVLLDCDGLVASSELLEIGCVDVREGIAWVWKSKSSLTVHPHSLPACTRKREREVHWLFWWFCSLLFWFLKFLFS